MAKDLSYGTSYQIISDAIFNKSIDLDLSNLGLKEIPSIISQLASSLRSINLSQNYFDQFPIDQLLALELLEWIDVSDNYIKELPVEIRVFKNLKSLTLKNNSLSSFPHEIEELTELTQINIDENEFHKFPIEISRLERLENLSIRNNGLENIPPEIEGISVKSLDLANNKIKTLPKSIKTFSGLESLDISHNQVTMLPKEIGEITSLTTLDLIGNEIASLPRSFRNLKNLRSLRLDENPIQLPPEIVNKHKNPNAIIEYYFSYLEHPLNECKILVVGQGSVGKTSLINRLKSTHGKLSETKTDGIAITKWQVDNNEDDIQKITLNLWDFGGQEIMHATHQFFLTKRSLYLLVLDARLTQEENRVEYWLKIIQSFGGESPVLIVGNKTDQHPLDIGKTDLKEKFSNIVGFIETSAKDGSGIDLLKDEITKQVNLLPHVRDRVPKTWFTVKSELEALSKSRNFIAEEDYINLCTNNKISSKESQSSLIGFLHDLGVILYFQGDPRLEALGILNPQWVTNGVYKILNSHDLLKNKGRLNLFLLNKILDFPEYPTSKRLFIVDMMKKFGLCYDIDPDNIFLVPDLLPKDKPAEFEFSGTPAFEYTYAVLLPSIITRFIVRMNQKIKDDIVWRTGVMLKIGENTALVRADLESNNISIAIGGVDYARRDALSTIRAQIDEIHNLFSGLEFKKLVPVLDAPNAEPLEYEYLLMLEQSGLEYFPIKDGNRLIDVNVKRLLSAVQSEKDNKKQDRTTTQIFVSGNFTGNMLVGDGNFVSAERIQGSINKIDATNMPTELKETLKQLAEAVNMATRSFPDEQAKDLLEKFENIVNQTIDPPSNKAWYSVSIDGLISAAEKLDKLGEPVINLSREILSLLTGRIIK